MAKDKSVEELDAELAALEAELAAIEKGEAPPAREAKPKREKPKLAAPKLPKMPAFGKKREEAKPEEPAPAPVEAAPAPSPVTEAPPPAAAPAEPAERKSKLLARLGRRKEGAPAPPLAQPATSGAAAAPPSPAPVAAAPASPGEWSREGGAWRLRIERATPVFRRTLDADGNVVAEEPADDAAPEATKLERPGRMGGLMGRFRKA